MNFGGTLLYLLLLIPFVFIAAQLYDSKNERGNGTNNFTLGFVIAYLIAAVLICVVGIDTMDFEDYVTTLIIIGVLTAFVGAFIGNVALPAIQLWMSYTKQLALPPTYQEPLRTGVPKYSDESLTGTGDFILRDDDPLSKYSKTSTATDDKVKEDPLANSWATPVPPTKDAGDVSKEELIKQYEEMLKILRHE